MIIGILSLDDLCQFSQILVKCAHLCTQLDLVGIQHCPNSIKLVILTVFLMCKILIF